MLASRLRGENGRRVRDGDSTHLRILRQLRRIRGSAADFEWHGRRRRDVAHGIPRRRRYKSSGPTRLHRAPHRNLRRVGVQVLRRSRTQAFLRLLELAKRL